MKPPNTHRIRIVVDASPEDPASGKRHFWLNLADGDAPAVFPHRRENGWMRSVVVADVPVPLPLVEVVGTVEGCPMPDELANLERLAHAAIDTINGDRPEPNIDRARPVPEPSERKPDKEGIAMCPFDGCDNGLRQGTRDGVAGLFCHDCDPDWRATQSTKCGCGRKLEVGTYGMECPKCDDVPF